MTTKALFIAALGGAGIRMSGEKTFVRSSGNILTATAHGLKTGAGPFKVMTSNADAPSGLVVAKHAESFVTGTSVIATDVLEVAGKNYTVIATPAADGDVDLGATDTETLANFAAAINQNRDAAATTFDLDTAPNPTVGAEVTDALVLTVTAKTLDATLGNAITLSSVDATLVADNATLENGADGTDYFFIELTDDTFSLATTKALAEAGTAQALADAGTGVHKLVRTVETMAEALEEVVVEHLAFPGNRSMPASVNTSRFWREAIAFTS